MISAPPLSPEKLSEFYESLGVREHAILRLPQLATAKELLATDAGQKRFMEGLQLRQQRLLLCQEDPLNWTFEAETWGDADAVLLGREVRSQSSVVSSEPARVSVPPSTINSELSTGAEAPYLLGIFGGNRAQKTWYAIKRACESAILFPGSRIAICSESEVASIATVQTLVWHYIKRYYEHLNGKRHSVTSVNYSQKGGFTERKLIFPNGSEIYFLTYNQEAGDYEGWEFGAPMEVYAAVSKRITAALLDETGAKDEEFLPINLAAWRAMGRTAIPNIGAVCDESMPMSWLKMFSRRVKFRHAKLLWPFTPVKGITPAIKEMVGSSARTLVSRPSALLPGQNFPELPAGHMPYIRQCSMTGAHAIYFFTIYNRFGPSATRTYYDEIKVLCAGKTTEYIERVAYGYARDGVARAFPNFSARNVVDIDQVPEVGTLYFIFDPHGTRNFPMAWAWVVPTRPASIYLVREWPDVPTHGEWAVPTEREVNEQNRKGWDGDVGPAQAGLGWGVVHYKMEILRQEAVTPPRALLDNNGELSAEQVEALVRKLPPWQRNRLRRALRNGESLLELRDEVAARYGDPRGIHNSYVSEQGGTTLADEFEKENTDEVTGRVVPPMELHDAATTRRSNAEEADEGITKVNELLGQASKEVVPVFGQPHLFVVRGCQQLIWMFENYTGRSGGAGACKDFADLVKYVCVSDLEHIEMIPRGKAGRGF